MNCKATWTELKQEYERTVLGIEPQEEYALLQNHPLGEQLVKDQEGTGNPHIRHDQENDNNDPEPVGLSVQLPPGLQKILEIHPELVSEIKLVMMKLYWDGYQKKLQEIHQEQQTMGE